MFDKEFETFYKNRPGLMEKFPDGGYVIVFEDRIFGVFPNRVAAHSAGVKEFGDRFFLINDIQDSDESFFLD